MAWPLPVVVPPLAAVIVAVMAAGLAWTVATPLVRAAESPTLPERLLRWSGQHRFVAVLAYLPLALSGRHALWAIPLAWIGLQITTHRVRRRIFGDTWSLLGQVWWNARAFLAVPGLWLAMAFAPTALLHSQASPAVVLAAGVALAAWLHFYNDVLCALLGARTVDAPALLAAFEPVLSRTSIRRPRIVHAGPRGGRPINAFALGAVRGDAVLFLDGLLEETTPAESAAVLAHEVGHLEDFTDRRWRIYAQGPALVAGGVAMTLAAGAYGWPNWLGLSWPVVTFGALLSRLLRSQQREADSDRRAVELCGDGEALIRALTIIHDAARVPRRFQPEFARQATHPSLARRIQAIRAISGVAPIPVEPRAFAGDGVPRAVVFEADRLVFVTLGDDRPDLGDVSGLVLRARQVEALPYAELSSLHVDPGRDDGAVLVAADRRGEARRLRIAERDVAAVQATLDIVDLRMGPPVVPPWLPQGAGRLAAVIALIAALPVFAWSVVAAALIAIVRPTTPLLAAVAAGLLMTAALQARQPSTSWRVAALVLIAGGAVAVAARQYRIARAAGSPFQWDGVLLAGGVVTAAAAMIPGWLILALGHVDAERLHVAARAFSSAAAGWAALGGLCLVMPRRLARIAAVAAFAIGAAIAAVGSDTFRDRVVPDPLIAPAPPVVVEDLAAAANGRISVPGRHLQVRLAPDAQHVVLSPVEDGSARAKRYTVAGFDGWRRTIDADDVRFTDAGTLLIARWEDQTLRLSSETVRTAAATWTLSIDDASTGGTLDADRSGRWRVEPYDGVTARGEWVRFEGRIGDATIRRIATPTSNLTTDIMPDRGVAASGATIAVRREFTGHLPALAAFLPDLTWRSVLERTGEAPGVLVRSRLAVDCSGPSLTSSTATCLATTGDDTFVWEVDADGGTPQPRALIIGRVVPRSFQDRTLLLWRDHDLLLLWRGTSRATRLASDEGRGPRAHDGAYTAGHLVTLTQMSDHDEVVRYPMTPPR